MSKTSYISSGAKIKAIGLGGGGCNAITRMIRENIQGVEFIAIDTDLQHLETMEATVCIHLAQKLTRGLGAGGDYNVGKRAAEDSYEELKEIIAGADMVFLVAGMGGGTGTGAIPVVADIAKSSGALTIAVVTKPFAFEGAHRIQTAEEGIENLIDKVDTLIIIANDRLLTLCDNKTSVDSAFKLVDDVLTQCVQAIAEVITTPGMINLDFSDVKAILKDAGPAWMSIGKGSGPKRAIDAATQAITSPLIEVSTQGSKAVLFNVVGGSSLTLLEVNQAADVIKDVVDPDANIIFGVANDPSMEQEVRITLIATGFQAKMGMDKNAEDEELTKILKNTKTEEELDMPSFLRRPLFSHKKSMELLPGLRPVIGDNILTKAYSIFTSKSVSKEQRSSQLKTLRDREIKANPNDPAVEFLNVLWRLSTDIVSVPDYANIMIRILQQQSPEFKDHPLYGFYSFILLACGIGSASDFNKISLNFIKEINKLQIIRIPQQIIDLFKMIESLPRRSFVSSRIEWLKNSEDILSDLITSLKLETQTPEVVCLTYVINRLLRLATGAIKTSLINLKCDLAISKPLYLNRRNLVQLVISGGTPGQSFRIAAPVTQNYDIQLNVESSVFQDPNTKIDLSVMPLVVGPIIILIEIEGITFQIDALVLLENPFIVGIPVQSDYMFVGRHEVLDRIIRGLVSPQPTNFLITGRRRIGKTSLLYAIKRQLPKNILPVLLSTETCGKSPTEVCQSLAKGISRAIAQAQSVHQKKKQLSFIIQDDPTGSFISWLEKIHSKLLSSSFDTMVILIDEALELIEWDDRVQKLLRYIFSSMTWIRGVLAGPPDIIERMTEHVSSPLYNIFTTLRLGPIDINDTHRLIISPLKNCGITNAEEMLKMIYDYSGGIPYYIQAIGSELIENYFSNKLKGEELLSKSLVQVRGRLKTSYPVTLKKLSAEQKVSIVLVASGVNPPEVSAKKLEQADLIERDDNKWIIRARLEKEWVKEYTDHLLDSAGQELWDSHKNEIDLLQLVEDLRKLKKEFASSEEVSQALTSAISAAEKGNGAKTLKYLGKVGHWVLNTATTIGADVAATAIKHIYGLT